MSSVPARIAALAIVLGGCVEAREREPAPLLLPRASLEWSDDARFCVEREARVECWGGKYGPSAREVEGLRGGVRAVFALDDVDCAVEESGRVGCWAPDAPGGDGVDIAPLTAWAPRGMEWNGRCASDGDGRAWCVVREGSILEVVAHPTLHGVRDIVLVGDRGARCACALRGGEAACTGVGCARQLARSTVQSEVSLGEADEIAVGGGALCVRTGRHVRCYDERGHDFHVQLPERSRVLRVLVEGRSGCAVHERGELSCWTGEAATPLRTPIPVARAWLRGRVLCVEGAHADVHCRQLDRDGWLRVQRSSERVEHERGGADPPRPLEWMPAPLPELDAPGRTARSLVALERGFCAVHGERVVCWGGFGLAAPTVMPGIDGAESLFTFGPLVCAVQRRTHVSCFSPGWLVVPQARRAPLTVEVSDARTWIEGCALVGDDGGVVCVEAHGIPHPRASVRRLELGREPTALARDEGGCACAVTSAGRARCVGTGCAARYFDARASDVDPSGDVVGWSRATDVAMAGSSVCVLDDRGVECRGPWPHGGAARVPLPDRLGPVRRLSSTGDWICALHDRGGASCWSGLDGLGSISVRQVAERGATDVAVSADDLAAPGGEPAWCVRDGRGRVFCRGDGRHGATGRELAEEREVTVAWDWESDPAIEVVAGDARLCARTRHHVICWGLRSRTSGECDWSPVELPFARGAEVVAVGEDGVCARRSDGAVVCDGVLGGVSRAAREGGMEAALGRIDRRAPVPTAPVLIPELHGAERLAVGRYHVCGVVGGAVRCAGAEALGESLVLGWPAPRLLRVPEIGGVRDVQALERGTCSLGDDGVRCWGGWPDAAREPFERAAEIALGPELLCARTDRGVECSYLDGERPRVLLPERGEGLALLGAAAPCLRSRARCWDLDARPPRAVRMPPFDAATADGATRCRLEAGRVICTGSRACGALGDGRALVHAEWNEVAFGP